MSHSFSKIWIHAVWSTKNRQPLITSALKTKLYNHLKEKFLELKCIPKSINGTSDHIHILFALHVDASVAKIIKTVKGESSHWINHEDFLQTKFVWQTGYGAFSVSASGLSEVEKYIRNQKEHHRNRTFQEEHDLFLEKYGIDTQGNR